MKTLELTPAELEMIKLKREQEELAKKEAELKKQAQLEKSIADKRAYMDKATIEDDEQIAAAQKFAAELGPRYQLNITTHEEQVTVKDYVNGTYTDIWSDTLTRRRATINYDKYIINVSIHIVYSNKWSSRGKNHGYKMYVSGPGIDYKYESKALSNAKTVNTKIDECIGAIKLQQDLQQKQKSAVENTVEKMRALYPDAVVGSSTSGERLSSGRYITYDVVTISFANGVSIDYRVYTDGSLGRKDIRFGVKDAWHLMDAISKINIIDNQ